MSSGPHPSPFSLRLIQWLCKEELVEELQGDLVQYHHELQASKTRSFKYWLQVLQYLRPSTLKSFNTQNSRSMFIFNPKLTFRNLYRHRSTSLISIFGFALGLVATFFLGFYIYAEWSTDRFHVDREKTYRILRVGEINGSPYRIGVTSAPFAQALLNDFPGDVESVTRVAAERGLVEVGDKKIYENDLLFVDENFFQFFSFPLRTGDPGTVLSTANSVVLSREAASKYFGDDNPIGQILTLDNEDEFIVSGVMDDIPANAHLNFSMAFRIDLLESYDWFGGWWSNNLITYLKIPSAAQASRLEDQFEGFMDKYFGEDFKQSGNRVGLELEPLSDVYFNDETRYDLGVAHGNWNSIITLGWVAIAILFIACFNYVNLSIAQSFSRSKEVGVRKVLGGVRSRLVLQLLSESLVIIMLAVLISIGICVMTKPYFNTFFGLEVVLDWLNPRVLIFLGVLISGLVLTSGLYPAFLLSSFKSLHMLRDGKLSLGRHFILRKSLVIIQFSISIFLIAASLLVAKQTRFLSSKSLGFDKEAIVLVDMNNSQIRRQRETFKKRLMANSNILGVTSFSGEPGGFHDASSFQVGGVDEKHRMRTLFTDVEYFKVMDIDIVAGRGFSKEIDDDQDYVAIFNEKAIKELGVDADEVIGKRLSMPGWDISNVQIVGVVADYHFIGLQNEIEPLAILTGGFHRKVALKVNMNNVTEQLSFLEETYNALVPDFPMSYQFLDDRLGRLYEKEQQQTRIFATFSGLSIFLACLGIFGLAAYAIHRRQKELGIRKVLGATARQIITLISREFVMLVALASIVAIPLAVYFLKGWLDGYAYRIMIGDHWYDFVLAGIATAAIALVTVILKTYEAAISNPIESIRDE